VEELSCTSGLGPREGRRRAAVKGLRKEEGSWRRPPAMGAAAAVVAGDMMNAVVGD
jgi:hypothetical protein